MRLGQGFVCSGATECTECTVHCTVHACAFPGWMFASGISCVGSSKDGQRRWHGSGLQHRVNMQPCMLASQAACLAARGGKRRGVLSR